MSNKQKSTYQRCGTYLGPLIIQCDRRVSLEHLVEPLFGLLCLCPLSLSQFAQPPLEDLLLFTLILAEFSEAWIFRMRLLEIGKVGSGGGNGGEKEGAVSGERLLDGERVSTMERIRIKNESHIRLL